MRILAFELGSRSVKAVELESRFRKFEVLDFHEVSLPLKVSDPIEIYREAISEIFAKLPSHPDKVVVSLPAPNISMRFLSIPVKQRKKVEQMYRFELEDSLPFKLDETVIEHEIYTLKDSSLVFTAIAPNRFIANYLEYLSKIGLDPDWLTFEGMGLINLFIASRRTEETQVPGPVLLLDLGHNRTTLSIVNESRIEAFRSFNWGGSNIIKSLAITTGLPMEDAEAEMHKVDLSQSGQERIPTEIMDAVNQAISLLLTEINHSLIAYRNTTKLSVTSIQISGGVSSMGGLSSFISKQLGGLPCSVFNPTEYFPIKEELKKAIDPAKFAEAWGRGNVFSRKSPLLFNFRRGNYGKQTSLNEISNIIKNPNIIKLAQYGAILGLMLFVHVFVSSYLASQENTRAHEELKKVFQDTFKNAPKALKNTLLSNPEKLKDYIDQKNKEMEQKLKMVSKSRESMITLIKKITSSFPSTVRVDVNRLEINDRNLVMEGVLYEGDLNQVGESLKKIITLNEVNLSQEGPRFTYRAKVTGR